MEFIEKHWLRIPIALYALGLVIHNVYLSQFGASEFELIKVKYILSGLGLVGFVLICFAYTSIKVNLSYIGDSCRPSKLFPWLLRVFSFPYVVYSILYSDVLFEAGDIDNIFLLIERIFFALAYFVVFFSLVDLICMLGEGGSIGARLIRWVQYILSVPMIIMTFITAWNVPAFSGIVKATLFFFIGFIGIGWRQADKKHGLDPKYLDSGTEKSHEDRFQVFFGAIAIFFVLGVVITNYTKYIYPKIPVALGGSKLEQVDIYYKSGIIDAKLIQQTSQWILYINNATGITEQLKSDSVDKVIYKWTANNAPKHAVEQNEQPNASQR